MRIAILTRPDNRSPKILAESLKSHLETIGVSVEIFEEIGLLNSLVGYKESRLNFHFWLKKKIRGFLKYAKLIKVLKRFDSIIISECSPNGFVRTLYNVERFRKRIKKPVLFYEVYYLGNAPYQIEKLKENRDALLERYDYHLSVAELTEIKLPVSSQWYPIGIYAKSWNLLPVPKEEIVAILDFLYPGNEKYRDTQIRALQKVGIKYISLEKPYTIEEIRSIYQQGSIYFMQSSEAFGLPVLECLCCGNQIFTPFSSWPMSWRLDETPDIHEDGILPECFTVYGNEKGLVRELEQFKLNYNRIETPKNVFKKFINNYPSFYYGNEKELLRILNNLKNN